MPLPRHCQNILIVQLSSLMHSGLYTGFLPRGGELGVCQKEAVRSCRGVGAGGGCAPSSTIFFTYLRSIYMSCDMLW